MSNSSQNSAELALDRKATHGSLRGYLFIALATLSWGSSATLGRAIFTGKFHVGGVVLQPIDPVILSQTRTTFTFLLLMPILLMRRGKGCVHLTRGELWRAMLLGAGGIAGSNFFYYFALEKTTVATAIILQYLAPAMVLIYMLVRRLQPATLQRLSGVAMALIGSVLAIGLTKWGGQFPFFGLRTHDLRFNAIGVAAGLAAAFCFAFTNVFGRSLVEATDRWRVFLYSMMGAGLLWVVVNPPWKIFAAHYTSGQWVFLFTFAVASMLVPYSFYFTGLQYLDATRAIVTCCLEPVFAIVIAAMALGETLGAAQIVGIVVTLAATVLIQVPDKKTRAEAIRMEMME